MTVRVLMLSHYYEAHGGGIEAVAARLAAGLAARGLAVTWMAADANPPPPAVPGLQLRAMAAWNGVERRTGIPFPLWTPRALWQLPDIVRAHDVLLVHDSLYTANLVGIAAARLAGRPVLLVQHIGNVPYRNPLVHGLVRLGNATATRWAMAAARRVVFISTAVQAWFTARNPELAAKAEFLPNGVDTATFTSGADADRLAARTALGVEDGPLLLFVGRFVAKKGLPLLRQLANLQPRCQFAFAGSGPLDPAAGCGANVRVLGTLTPAQLSAWYRAADYLLLPSFGEGFPLVVQEALACGLPTLVAEEVAAACPDFGTGLHGLPVTGKADDVTAWNRALSARLTEIPNSATRATIAGRAAALWSWDRTLDRYAALVRALAVGTGQLT
jgi:glycosyltransferase involved in cell wall biosynthesis